MLNEFIQPPAPQSTGDVDDVFHLLTVVVIGVVNVGVVLVFFAHGFHKFVASNCGQDKLIECLFYSFFRLAMFDTA